jgi:hypothetical protein
MLLSSTTRSITAILAADADPTLKIVSSYKDTNLSSGRETRGSYDNMTDDTDGSATAVDVVPAPAEAVMREVESINIYNSDNATATISIRLTGGLVTNPELIKVALATLEQLCWSPGLGWHVLTTAGLLRETV